MKNWIFIFTDGCRADIINNPENTPYLHDFMEQYGGYKFTEAYSTATWTWASLNSMFTGWMPSKHGCSDITFARHDLIHKRVPGCFKAPECKKEDFITTDLKNLGYYSTAWLNSRAQDFIVSGNQIEFDKWITSDFDYNWYRFRIQGVVKEPIIKPFFYFIEMYEAGHAPFGPLPCTSREIYQAALATGKFPNEHEARENAVKWSHENLINLVSIQAQYWDKTQLHNFFFPWFVQNELYKDTAFLIVADHGTALRDENRWVGHGLNCYEEIVHVPLWVYMPGYDKGLKEINNLVSIADIAPTILGKNQIEAGFNLFKDNGRRAVYLEHERWDRIAQAEKGREFLDADSPPAVIIKGVRWETYKLLRLQYKSGKVEYELYDFSKTRRENESTRICDEDILKEGVGLLKKQYPDIFKKE
jgi:hypothetical protein